MASGGFTPSIPYGDPGDPGSGSGSKVDGIYAGRSFPVWGDPCGDYGQMQVLRLEGVDKALPKRPFEIRKAVEAHLGVRIEKANPEAKGVSYVIKLRNQQQVEKLKKMTQLPDGTKIKIAEHPTRNQCRCVVYCPESTEYSTDQLLNELNDQGVKSLRRITRKVGEDTVPTPTIILTIDGTVVPQSINFGWIRVRTRPYYPTPMLCYGCFEYGHPRKRCTAQNLVCGVCCGNHANTLEIPCQEKAFCKHCKSDAHPVASKKCPIYLKEVDIQHLMVDQGIGYPAARRIFEANYRTKTTAAVVAEGNDARFAELHAKFDKLLVETGKKDNQIEIMRVKAAKHERQIDELFEIVKKKDEQLAEKNAEIAVLKAALAAANIPIPSTAKSSATGTISKQKKKNDKNDASQPNPRSRSRSPKGSIQRDGKDGRQSRARSRPSRRPELDSRYKEKKGYNSKAISPNQTSKGEEFLKDQGCYISDSEDNIHSPTTAVTQTDPEMVISSDGSTYFGLLELEDLP